MNDKTERPDPSLHIHVWSDPDKETGEIDIIEEVDTDFFDYYRVGGEEDDAAQIDYFQFGATVQGKYLEIRLNVQSLAQLTRTAMIVALGDHDD